MPKYTYFLEDIDDAAKFILEHLKSPVLLFDGDMGSGKTTLIKALVKQLKAKDEANSPTFSIVNEYQTPDKKIYHFDLYRINNFEEALDFGIEEYLNDEHAYVFIEWADVISELLPDNSQKIRIIVNANNSRELQMS